MSPGPGPESAGRSRGGAPPDGGLPRGWWSSARARRWALLGVLLAGAVAALLVARSGRDPASEPAGPPEPVLRLRVVDERGAPVAGVRVRVRAPAGAPREQAGRWSAEAATLDLPPGHGADAVLFEARGWRRERVSDLRPGERAVVLRPGYLLRILLTAEPVASAEDLRIVLLVRPLAGPEGPLEGAAQDAVADLIAPVGAGGDGAVALPRGAFGVPVLADEAAQGVRLPDPGRYSVRWGLLDRRAGVLFALDDETGVEVEVGATDAERSLEVVVGPERIAAAREGLAARVRALPGGTPGGEGGAADGPPDSGGR